MSPPGLVAVRPPGRGTLVAASSSAPSLPVLPVKANTVWSGSESRTNSLGAWWRHLLCCHWCQSCCNLLDRTPKEVILQGCCSMLRRGSDAGGCLACKQNNKNEWLYIHIHKVGNSSVALVAVASSAPSVPVWPSTVKGGARGVRWCSMQQAGDSISSIAGGALVCFLKKILIALVLCRRCVAAACVSWRCVAADQLVADVTPIRQCIDPEDRSFTHLPGS